MATADTQRRDGRSTGTVYSWVNDLLQTIKDLLTLPQPPELVPIPVRKGPRRPPPRQR